AGIDWEGIGGPFKGDEFTGSFDGKGHTIKNLTSTKNDTGLFNHAVGSTIKNVNFTNVNIEKDHRSDTAAVASYLSGGVVENVEVDGFIKGGGKVGGVIAAGARTSKIVNTHVNVEIVAGAYTGGAAGAIVGDAVVNVENS